MNQDAGESFFELTAERILDSVEAALIEGNGGVRATGRILALNSLENRVHEIEFEDGSKVVSKFYRPGRWSREQISEEHEFLFKLKAAEIPVVAPVVLGESRFSKVCRQNTLAESQEGIFFAVFPKVRGRLRDELSTSQLQTLGRYLGRIHQIGKAWKPQHRLHLNTENWGWWPLEDLEESEFLQEPMRSHYIQACEDFLDRAEDLLPQASVATVHGDCHLGNTLWEGESPYFLDFDDMMVAPPVQDIWMVIRGRDEEALKQREVLLRSYESMCNFDWESLELIEVLRGLRIIHYSAWIAKRMDDPAFTTAFPHFGSDTYWRSEIEALQEILSLI